MEKRNYYIDRVRILFTAYTGAVKQRIGTNLNDYCKKPPLIRNAPKGILYGTRLDVFGPTKECFSQLEELVGDIRNVISYIELACDEPCESESSSKQRFRWVIEHIWRKYAKDCVVYRPPKSKVSKSPTQDGLYSELTVYVGGMKSRTKYTVYPRIGKHVHVPSVHFEWRLRQARNIRSKTGIRTIKDLKAANVEDLYLKLTEKFVVYQKVNHVSHGRFVQGFSKKNPKIILNGIRAGQVLADEQTASKLSIRLWLYRLRSVYRLRKFYDVQKRKVRKKEESKQRLDAWEKKIRKLNYKRLSSFFLQVKYPYA